MAIDPTRDPHAHIVTKPLPSQVRKGEGGQSSGYGSACAGDSGRVGARAAGAAQPPDPFLRPENEDDDGYDPYSDRPVSPEPLFQEDPWN